VSGPDQTTRLIGITLDERTVVRRNPDVEHERAVAIYDLLEENSFRPAGDLKGPFHLHLSAEESRLMMDIQTPERALLTRVMLPLAPFRKIVRDYFMICESYYNAIRKLSPTQIEAIDMGRRGIHNDGAELLRERLADSVEIDQQTARGLFTLICVLHLK
jgi:uncharacterized protein (UPF0262 family)